MNHSKIAYCSSYIPKNVVSNYDLENFLDTSQAWIKERTGIDQRNIALDHLDTSDLAILATQDLLNSYECYDVDYIVVATCTPDRHFPAVANRVHKIFFSNRPIPAFDMQVACSGFVYGIEIADNLIKSGKYKNILLISVDKMSKILDWHNRNTCILFGDGASATIIKKAHNLKSYIMDSVIQSDGKFCDLLKTSKIGNEKQNVFMSGQDVFKYAVYAMQKTITNIINSNNINISDIKYIVPHQANKRIIDCIIKQLNIPSQKIVTTIDKHANCSAASIPLALNYLIKSNKIKQGDKIITVAFGAGFTWGGNLIKW